MSIWDYEILESEMRGREKHFTGNNLLIANFYLNFSLYLHRKRKQNTAHPSKARFSWEKQPYA